MKIILRFIIFVATIAAVLALLVGGVFLGTGNLDILKNTGLMPDIGGFQSAPNGGTVEPGAPDVTDIPAVLSFTWQADEIVYQGNSISEDEFAALLEAANTKDAKVEIIKFSDVRVESADRRRQLLDASGVRYEMIPQE